MSAGDHAVVLGNLTGPSWLETGTRLPFSIEIIPSPLRRRLSLGLKGWKWGGKARVLVYEICVQTGRVAKNASVFGYFCLRTEDHNLTF